MDIEVLKNFLIVAREGNITRAAGLVHLTQSTLSRQIIGLEKELGAQLLERKKYNVLLTEQGMLFRRRAQELVSISDLAYEEMQHAGSELVGEIAIGCNESQSMMELTDFLSAFRKMNNRITFDLRSGNNNDVKDWLDRGIVDIGLLVEPVNTQRYSYIRMKKRDKWGILVSERHALASEKGVRAEDLVGVPMLTIRDEVIHSELTNWSGKYADRMVPLMHYNLLSNAAAFLLEADCVAVCSKPFCKYSGLVFRQFDPPLYLGSLLAWKEQQTFSRATQAFINYLKDIENASNNN